VPVFGAQLKKAQVRLGGCDAKQQSDVLVIGAKSKKA